MGCGPYPIGAKVQLNNLIYITKAKNTNISPGENTATWIVYGLQEKDLKDASTTQKGVVQLLNVLTSDSVSLALMAAQGKALKAEVDAAKTRMDDAGLTTFNILVAGINLNTISKTGFYLQPANANASILESQKNTASKAANGWWKCGVTGVIQQWGTYSGSTDTATITFPTRFPNLCTSVQAIVSNTRYDSQSNILVTSKSITSFSIKAAVGERPAAWFAVGY